MAGLIVDTFSELRQEAHERDDVLTNSCFVCGITRAAYEDIGLPHGPSFDQHRDETHNVWNYVYFYLYLQRKDPTEYNGVESFVSMMLKEHNLGESTLSNVFLLCCCFSCLGFSFVFFFMCV
jgi:hypothetical protein